VNPICYFNFNEIQFLLHKEHTSTQLKEIMAVYCENNAKHMLCVDKVKIIVMLKQEVCTILVNRDLKKTFGPTGSPLSTERLKEDSRICLT
jgi:hypothetical protein